MKVHASKYNLTDSDLNLLDKVARHSKMECWFQTTNDGYFRDIEKGVYKSPKTMVRDLINGMTDYDWSLLTTDEEKQMNEIKKKINYKN